MVAPSCCLEYEPTIYFWLILIFFVFPMAFIAGKVIGCFISILLRMLIGLGKFLIWDDENKGEIEDNMQLQETLRKTKYTNSNQTLKKSKNGKAPVTSIFSKSAVRNDIPVETIEILSSDISDSLNSDCEEERLQKTQNIKHQYS